MPAAPPKAIVFLANNGQDPTEAAIPWEILTSAGCIVTFATEHGEVASADPVLLQSGVFASLLGPSKQATDSYKAMVASPEYQQPRAWSDKDFDILEYEIAILPGGHDKPIRQYLECQSLHEHLGRFLPHTARTCRQRPKVLGAICHGVLALAFAKCPVNPERSLLAEHGLQTTTLPKWMEGTAWVASQAWLKGSYYRTYIERGGWCCGDVEEAGGSYIRGPMSTKPFVHTDPNHRYISARFPGDAELWTKTILSEAKEAFGVW